MRRSATALVLTLLTLSAACLAGAPAQAATGQVVVFSTELQPLDVYQNPTGCVKLPLLAHVLDNLTDQSIRVYADPNCTVPATLPDANGVGSLPPNHGSHVTGIGSFSL
ncbi:hypothetical protein [Streptacidiphilus anmyonensis]|uniref:hypothetical protein n=1 Tax=Streptacidiphilus anmyonensis TaxID=405782 RepID=UPI0005A8B950|nr:hypothetical protein [Streptacidiphilus anmyonensis]